MLDFDVKKFLLEPMNDGSFHMSKDGLGCLKCTFAKAWNRKEVQELIEDSRLELQVTSEEGVEVDSWFNFFGFYDQLELSWYGINPVLKKEDPMLAAILDRGEFILMEKKKPQFAKLFVIRALRKYNYLPKETSVKEAAYV